MLRKAFFDFVRELFFWVVRKLELLLLFVVENILTIGMLAYFSIYSRVGLPIEGFQLSPEAMKFAIDGFAPLVQDFVIVIGLMTLSVSGFMMTRLQQGESRWAGFPKTFAWFLLRAHITIMLVLMGYAIYYLNLTPDDVWAAHTDSLFQTERLVWSSFAALLCATFFHMRLGYKLDKPKKNFGQLTAA